MKLLEQILARAIHSGSGGGSGGATDTGVVAVKYDNSKEYEYSEGVYMNKISDMIPSLEDLTGAMAIFPFSDSSATFNYVGYSLAIVQDPELPGLVICGMEENIGIPPIASVNEEAANILGITPGLWGQPFGDRAGDFSVYYLWETK